MALVLSEEQILLQESAKGFLSEKAPLSEYRKLRDEKSADGFSRQLWAEIVDMGWPGIVIPEAHGGLEYGYVGAGIIMEEMGRTLTASPMLSTAILGASLIASEGSDDQKSALLCEIAAGKLITAFAIDEGPHHGPKNTAMTATAKGNGYLLNGQKSFVLDGHVADELVVAARTSGEAGEKEGITLFLMPADTDGVNRDRTIMMDHRNAARISFDNVSLTGDQILGQLDKGYGASEKALNIGRACLAAEMLGTARECLDRTVAYLKERKQFGVPIGSFQALQHRAAHLFSEIELAKSVVLKALQAIDADDPMSPVFSSLAKAKMCEVAHLASNEAVQMHGGMGMTDEFDIGFFMKRANVLEKTFGDYNFHADRLARMKGY
jgi:alkylation response protein AidB-like acyl-CoA dehydrogenase